MLNATILTRVFVFTQEGQEISLPDPNEKWTTQKVLDYYTGTYPILTTAKVAGGGIENDQMVYRFESTIGTKG
jgi:PRTRC genetic system protein C